MRLDPTYVTQLTQSISASSANEQRLATELSSGLKVASLRDDAVAVSANALLTQGIAQQAAFVQTAASEQSLLQTTDTTLGEVVTQVTSAVTLAVSAANTTLNDANRAALGQQLTDLRDNVLALGNTSYQGHYLFSGSKGDTQPFALHATTPLATVSYAGDTVTQTVATPNGQSVAVNVAGSSVFTAAGADVLGTLNQLIADVTANNAAGIRSGAVALTTALGQVSLERATIGSSLAQLNAAQGYASTQQAQLLARQSTLLSADPAAVATEFKDAQVQHQALLSVVAALSKSNLFDYLK